MPKIKCARDHFATEGRDNRGHPWKTNNKYSTEEKEMIELGESKLCKVRKHRYYQSFAGKIAASNKKKKEKKSSEKGLGFVVKILSDPPKVSKSRSRLIRQRTEAMVIRIPAFAFRPEVTHLLRGATLRVWETGLFEAPYRRQ